MYDRQTRSLWPQLRGQAVAGALTGTELAALPVATVSWKTWRDAHPFGWVLSRDTGFDRSYGSNPYPGYDDIHSRPLLFDGTVDGRLPAMAHVVAIGTDPNSAAVPFDRLRHQRVVDLDIGGRPLVVWLVPGTASALDRADIASGGDVGATGVFDPTVEGRRPHFRADGDHFRDDETGSRWDVLGEAVAGPFTGRVLAPVRHVDTFWFAWAAFEPSTRIIG
jgi:hypothetical protein